MAVQERLEGFVVVVEGVVDIIGGQYHRQWQVAGGKALGQAYEIRSDARLLTGKQGAGAAKTNGNLIGNQVHAIAVAGFPQFGVVDGMVHAHAAGALDQRLHHHGADFVVLLGQQLFHGLKLAQCIGFVGLTRLLVEGVR